MLVNISQKCPSPFSALNATSVPCPAVLAYLGMISAFHALSLLCLNRLCWICEVECRSHRSVTAIIEHVIVLDHMYCILTLHTLSTCVCCSQRLWESVLMTNSTAKPALLAAVNSTVLLEDTFQNLRNISQKVAAAVGPKPPLHLQPPPPHPQQGSSQQSKTATTTRTTTSSGSSSTTGGSGHNNGGPHAGPPVTVDQTRISNSATTSSKASSSSTPSAAGAAPSSSSSSGSPGLSSSPSSSTSGSSIRGSISAADGAGYSTMVTGGSHSTSSSSSISGQAGAPMKQSEYGTAARSGFLLAALANTRLFPELLPSSSAQELQWLQVAAQAGNVDAQLALADRFMTGRGVEPDCEHGMFYLKLAAAQVVAQVEKVRGDGWCVSGPRSVLMPTADQ